VTKMVEATCVGGVVKIDGFPVAGAVVMGQGIGPSSGVAFLDGTSVTYVPLQQTDLKNLITQLSTIVTQIAAITAALDAVTVSPGGTLALTAQLVAMQVQLAAMGEMLQ